MVTGLNQAPGMSRTVKACRRCVVYRFFETLMFRDFWAEPTLNPFALPGWKYIPEAATQDNLQIRLDLVL